MIRIYARLQTRLVILMFVALTYCGCVTTTKMVDRLPEGTPKGFVSFTLEVFPATWVLKGIWVYQYIDDTKQKRIGWMSSDAGLEHAYGLLDLRIAARPGQETFFVTPEKFPITVKVVQGMRTPVRIIFTKTQENRKARWFDTHEMIPFLVSFRVDEPVPCDEKGNFKDTRLIEPLEEIRIRNRERL
ncbi:hypothetical protein ACFL4G_10245 [Thermodesulfobacteriota bacterium]